MKTRSHAFCSTFTHSENRQWISEHIFCFSDCTSKVYFNETWKVKEAIKSFQKSNTEKISIGFWKTDMENPQRKATKPIDRLLCILSTIIRRPSYAVAEKVQYQNVVCLGGGDTMRAIPFLTILLVTSYHVKYPNVGLFLLSSNYKIVTKGGYIKGLFLINKLEFFNFDFLCCACDQSKHLVNRGKHYQHSNWEI